MDPTQLPWKTELLLREWKAIFEFQKVKYKMNSKVAKRTTQRKMRFHRLLLLRIIVGMFIVYKVDLWQNTFYLQKLTSVHVAPWLQYSTLWELQCLKSLIPIFRLLTRNGCFRWKLLLCSLEVTESCLFIYYKPPVVQDILSCLTFYVSLKVEAVLDFRSLGLVC